MLTHRVGGPGRRRLWLLLLVAVTAAGGGWLSWSFVRLARAMPECPDRPPVVLDPGHGGIDGGTNIPGMLEKEIVLDIALRTERHLERYGVPVVLTRSEDVDLGGPNGPGRLRRDLIYRIRVANHCKAALMLSLHVNSASTGRERGMMIFYQPSRASRDAAALLDAVLRGHGLHSRREEPHVRKDFAVLKTRAPALLLELGFITSQEDRELLGNEAYRERVAQVLATSCVTIYHKWMKQGAD